MFASEYCQKKEGRPLPELFGPFSPTLHFWSIQTIYFFKNTNALILELFFKAFGEVPFLNSPWASLCSFCLEMLWGERSNLGNIQKKKLFFFRQPSPNIIYWIFSCQRVIPIHWLNLFALKMAALRGEG